jgi:ectoine hydroxylase-related dioxygenase (phytanoyl-CoA dioxygenase family)
MTHIRARAAKPARSPLPRPTRDLEQAKADLAEHGLCLIADALPPAKLRRVRDALYRAAEEDRARGWEQKFIGDYEHDSTNQRIWNLLSREPVFIDLVEHPASLEIVRHLIGWPALLSNISANITGPGGGEMILHADQGYMPEPWARPQGVNMIWCVDDFTEENGGTRIVPGSHLLNRTPRDDEQGAETVALEAPAGTLVAMEGRVWHKTGFNRTEAEKRAGIFAWYTLPIYLPQENWYLSLNPAVRQFASETLLELLGLKAQVFGRVNGASPA